MSQSSATININQITKYIKFNKSAIKFSVNENKDFVQPHIIPQRTEDPNAALLDNSSNQIYLH